MMQKKVLGHVWGIVLGFRDNYDLLEILALIHHVEYASIDAEAKA